MRSGVARTVLAPLVLVVAVVYALVHELSPEPETAPAPPPSADLLSFRGTPDETDAASRLWAAYGKDLTQDGRLPESLAALDAREAVYVLLTTRAAQVAAAVDAAAPQALPADVLAGAGLAPDPADVTTSRTGPRGCVVLTYSREALGRSYYGWADAPEATGTEPESALEGVLRRTSRVGLSASDAARCGTGVAYSPQAKLAIAALRPALLR